MSDAPELISLELRQGLSDDFWSECRDPRYAKSEPVAYVRADRIEKLEALLREAMAALDDARGLLVDAMVQLTDGKIKTRRNRALLIQDFLSRDKEQPE